MKILESLWLLGWLLALLGGFYSFFFYSMGRQAERELEDSEAQLAEESQKARDLQRKNENLCARLAISEVRHESRERHVTQCAAALSKIALAGAKQGTAVVLPSTVLTPDGEKPVAWLVHVN